MKDRILIVEDDKIMRVTLTEYLINSGYAVHAFEKGIDGIAACNEDEFSLVITDVRLPDMDGFNLLKALKKKAGNIPVIVMTAFGTIKDAVEAIKIGAFDYITKPFSLDEFTLIVKRALEVKALREENLRLKRDLSVCFGYQNIIGESAVMTGLFQLIEKVAETESNILISGESGTGKEMVASSIHYRSKRKNGPFIKVNCGAFPENLVESELFGYEKGAFTGAAQRKPGRFERADKGTIFLDEIGDLPLSAQIKLLRVLQDSTFERLGGTEELKVDIRVMAAANKDLKEEVNEGRFREDLYYRLNVIPVHMPALRERQGDIPLLIEHFLDIYNCRLGKRVKLSSEVIRVLMDYEFPGNVRELENVIERCVALSTDNIIDQNALPSHLVKSQEERPAVTSLNAVAADAEKAHIMRILLSTKGNKTRAAEVLSISRKTLWEKIKAYNIE